MAEAGRFFDYYNTFSSVHSGNSNGFSPISNLRERTISLHCAAVRVPSGYLVSPCSSLTTVSFPFPSASSGPPIPSYPATTSSMALRLCLRSSWLLAASAPVCFCAIPTGTAPVCFPAVHTRLSVPFSALGTFCGSPRPARPPGSFPGTQLAGKFIDGHRRRTRLPPHHRPPGSLPLVCCGTGDVVGASLPLPLCPPRPPDWVPWAPSPRLRSWLRCTTISSQAGPSSSLSCPP